MTANPPLPTTSSWSRPSTPPRRVPVPLPDIRVEMVTAPISPARATMAASSSLRYVVDQGCEFLLHRQEDPAGCMDADIRSVPAD